jgi:citrate lyase beta subunit
MGWSSGANLMESIITDLEDALGFDERVIAYKILVEAFQDHDCDNLCEVMMIDPAFDTAIIELNPDYTEYLEEQADEDE